VGLYPLRWQTVVLRRHSRDDDVRLYQVFRLHAACEYE
jgi:hypothetical protein